jgi:Pentapeptide repeats (8 copies)
VAADLRNTSWWKSVLVAADLSRSDLRGARFADTLLDEATRLDGAIGLDEANVETILVGGRRLVDTDARAWLVAQASRPAWSIEQLELWLLAKMSSPRVASAIAALGKSDDDLRRVAGELGVVFDKPGHAAAEYRRILGAPIATTMATATGTFAGSMRHEHRLPLWPDVVFVVNEHPDGYAWGAASRAAWTRFPSVSHDRALAMERVATTRCCESQRGHRSVGLRPRHDLDLRRRRSLPRALRSRAAPDLGTGGPRLMGVLP